MNFEFIGYSAAFLTTFSLLPQTLKLIKSKNVESISLIAYTMFCIGVLLWLAYGFYMKSIPMILANGITLIFSFTIVFLKIKHTKKIYN